MRAILFCSILSFYLSGLMTAQDKPSYMPNPALTPGETVEVTKDDLCEPGRHELEGRVPVALKRRVFDRYAIGPNTIGYNVDRLIPEKLGGSNSIKNLWPQPLSGKWTYSMKNRLEQRMYKMVCSGDLELKTARQEIAADWVSAYKRYIGESGQSPQSQR